MSAGRRARHLIAGGLLGVLALTGCTPGADEQPVPTPSSVDLTQINPDDPDGNGLWYLRDADLVGQIIAAVAAVDNMRVRGTLTERVLDDQNQPVSGRELTINVQRQGDDYSARITADGSEVALTVIGGDAYISGNTALADEVGVPEIAEGAVCLTPEDTLIQRWAPLTDPELLLRELLLSTETAASGLEPSVDDDTVEVVIGDESAPIGRITTARVGQPLPSDLVLSDESGSADLRFDGGGASAALEAPGTVSRPCG